MLFLMLLQYDSASYASYLVPDDMFYIWKFCSVCFFLFCGFMPSLFILITYSFDVGSNWNQLLMLMINAPVAYVTVFFWWLVCCSLFSAFDMYGYYSFYVILLFHLLRLFLTTAVTNWYLFMIFLIKSTFLNVAHLFSDE